MDFDDCWDSLVKVEEDSYREGYEEGRAAAQTSGIREDGQRGGFLKGLAYGLELGFVEQYATQASLQLVNTENYILTTPIDDADHIPPSPPDNSSPRPPSLRSTNQHRNEKRIKEMLEAISKIPSTNNTEIDFDKEVQHIRSLYRQAGTPLGPFPPNLTHSNEIKKVVVTHEW